MPVNIEPGQPPMPLVRQIRNSFWIYGENYLMQHPELTEIDVFDNNYTLQTEWKYKVVRQGTDFVRQTWQNGILRHSYICPRR